MRSWRWAAVVAWIVVVATGAALSWVAIDRAGRAVTDADDVSETPVAQATLTGPTGTPSASPSRKPKPTSRPSATPSATRSSSPATSAPSTPTAPPASSTPSAPPSQERTWTGAAGSVTARCVGSDARIIGASPAYGWHVEREGGDDGVKFERNEVETRVRVDCRGGVPVFEVRTEGESEGGEDR